MKNLIYQVVIGDYDPVTECFVNTVAKYCRRHNITHYVQKNPQLYIQPKRSSHAEKYTYSKLTQDYGIQKNQYTKIVKDGFWCSFEKFNALSFAKDFDNICILDTNIYIKKDAPNIFDSFENQDIASTFLLDQPWIDDYSQKILSRFTLENYQHLKSDISFPIKNKTINVFGSDVLLFNSTFIKKYFVQNNILEWLNQEDFHKFIHRKDDFNLNLGGIGETVLLNYWTWKDKIKVHPLSWKWCYEYNSLSSSKFDIHEKDCFFVNFKTGLINSEPNNNLHDHFSHDQGYAKKSSVLLQRIRLEADIFVKEKDLYMKFNSESIEKTKMIAIKLAEECDHNAKYESSNVGFIIAQLLKIIEQLEKEKSCKDF